MIKVKYVPNIHSGTPGPPETDAVTIHLNLEEAMRIRTALPQ